MREITVVTENKVGALATVCELLGGVGVNIRAISAQAVGDKGVIRLLTEDETSAKNVLERSGFKISMGDVVTVKLKDRPGELAKVARKLAVSKVDIESVYILGKANTDIELAIRPSSVSGAMSALKK